MALTHKQQLFVDAYLRCWNATRAAIEAGYSEKTARQQGSRLLTNVDVQDAIQKKMAESAMNTNEVLYHLAQIARTLPGQDVRRDPSGCASQWLSELMEVPRRDLFN